MNNKTLIISLCGILIIFIGIYIYFTYYIHPIPHTTEAPADNKLKADSSQQRKQDNSPMPLTYTIPELDTTHLDSLFQANKLQDIQLLDSTIRVDLKYASEDNFMKTNVYGNLKRAYLRPQVARMLVKANALLSKSKDKFQIIVFDAARPQSVQFKMWDLVVNTPSQIYVAPPVPGSLHNFGCSVDVGLVDSLGNLVDMGTPYDSFDSLAQPRFEKYFLKLKRLTTTQIANRKALRKAMQKAGFIMMVKEWWHFDAYNPYYVMSKFKIIK